MLDTHTPQAYGEHTKAALAPVSAMACSFSPHVGGGTRARHIATVEEVIRDFSLAAAPALCRVRCAYTQKEAE